MSFSLNQDGDFRSGEHLGRQIAVIRHRRVWCVFLDQRLLEPFAFETAEDAANWLQRRVENHTN